MAISPFFQPVGDESQARVVEHVGHKPGDWVGLWSEDLRHQQLSTGLTMFAFEPADLLISPLFFRVWLQAQGPCWAGGGVGSPQAEVTVTTVSLFKTFFFWAKGVHICIKLISSRWISLCTPCSWMNFENSKSISEVLVEFHFYATYVLHFRRKCSSIMTFLYFVHLKLLRKLNRKHFCLDLQCDKMLFCINDSFCWCGW